MLVVLDLVDLWIVVVWSLITGALAALVAPAQQAILPQLIDMRAVASAVAFNSSIWNTMRILGPAVAGVIIAFVGIGQAFFVTTVGYAIASVLLFTLRTTPRERRPAGAGQGMLAGARYIFHNQLFLAVIGLSFFTSVFGGSYQVLLVFFANDILGVAEVGFGLLEAAAGVGAILGTLSIIKIGAGTLSRIRNPRRGGGVWRQRDSAFAASTYMPLSMLTLFASGFASGIYLNVGMTALQMQVPDDLRGRVMGIWSMTWNLASVGGFFAGAAAELIGIQLTVAFGGLSVAGFAVLLLLLSSELRALPSLHRDAGAGGRGAYRLIEEPQTGNATSEVVDWMPSMVRISIREDRRHVRELGRFEFDHDVVGSHYLVHAGHEVERLECVGDRSRGSGIGHDQDEGLGQPG